MSEPPTLVRAVSRWQIVGLSINDVIGSGIYLLPAAAAALLGPASVWAILFAGFAVGLIVLCYAQAASYFDQPGGAYLYTREAFGGFVGFEIGWMTWLTRLSTAAALANALALAVAALWPPAADGLPRAAIAAASLLVLTGLNLIGVRSGARTGVVLVIGKMLPLVFFAAVGVAYVDWSAALAIGTPPAGAALTEAALLLLFAYAGFENTPAAAGEYKDPQRNVPFAMLTMIVIVTITYVVIQMIALGTLPGIAASKSPLAEAAAGFAGAPAAWLMTIGAALSILGTNNNTILFGARYAYAMSRDGVGPAAFAGVHPRYRTPAFALLVQLAIALPLALSGSFVQLALLSVISRLFAYTGTAASLLVLRRRFADRADALRLPGGPLIPLGALVVSLTLLASAGWKNLAAAAAALALGAVIYAFRRKG
ncbi:MAG: APC family permease [Gammaproteobacteria bacterium]